MEVTFSQLARSRGPNVIVGGVILPVVLLGIVVSACRPVVLAVSWMDGWMDGRKETWMATNNSKQITKSIQ